MRRASLVAAALALVCVALGVAAGFWRTPAERVALVEASLDVGACPVGKPNLIPFTLRVRNDSGHTVEVNNVVEGCGLGACLQLDQPMPVRLPPGAVADVRCLVLVTRPGPFRRPSAVFVAGRTLHVLPFEVCGVGIDTAPDPSR